MHTEGLGRFEAAAGDLLDELDCNVPSSTRDRKSSAPTGIETPACTRRSIPNGLSAPTLVEKGHEVYHLRCGGW